MQFEEVFVRIATGAEVEQESNHSKKTDDGRMVELVSTTST